MAPPNSIGTRIRSLTVAAIALTLAVMIALVLAGGATSDARVAPTGVHHPHKHHHHHHKHRHQHKHRRHHHKAVHRHHHRATGTPKATPTPPTAPSPVVLPVPVAVASSPNDPLAGDKFYLNPSDSAVAAEQQLLAQGQTAEAATIEKIASQPEAIWLTSASSLSVVPQIMSAAAANGTVPVFVAYDIPWRDCGQYSSGGAADAADYEQFINSLTLDLGQGKAVVIVEPDALTEMSCLSSSQQQTYDQLIGYAVQHLDTDANASPYVDAGNPTWLPAATEASLLQQAIGSAKAGFAINVSSFSSQATGIAYGNAISQQTGGRHYVIDTSRAGGSVAAGQWCNPAGAKIGADPTAATANPAVDAFLWIKDVGESDGACNGGPAAGQFWLSYALSLAG
jgi:endoglucanase